MTGCPLGMQKGLAGNGGPFSHTGHSGRDVVSTSATSDGVGRTDTGSRRASRCASRIERLAPAACGNSNAAVAAKLDCINTRFALDPTAPHRHPDRVRKADVPPGQGERIDPVPPGGASRGAQNSQHGLARHPGQTGSATPHDASCMHIQPDPFPAGYRRHPTPGAGMPDHNHHQRFDRARDRTPTAVRISTPLHPTQGRPITTTTNGWTARADRTSTAVRISPPTFHAGTPDHNQQQRLGHPRRPAIDRNPDIAATLYPAQERPIMTTTDDRTCRAGRTSPTNQNSPPPPTQRRDT